MSLSPTHNDKIQDSLDNLSNLKLRQSSLEKQRVQIIQLKQRFISLLEKLQTSQTRQISLTQLKKLIQKHTEPDHLKMYLSILKSLKPDHNSTTKQHQVLVISIIAKVFKSNLIDPVDKQPSLLKTCFKVVEICLGFFNDNSNTVQQACARVLLDLNEFCLEQAILKNGVDKASQATATVCINQLIKYWYANHARDYLDQVVKDIFAIILKINSEYHEIFMSAIILIQHKGLPFFQNRLPNFISKILPIIDGTRQTANSFNSYMVNLPLFKCKVNVCKILQKIATLLTPEERQKLTDLNIINSLSKAARNKIIQVQTAATRAIKVWKGESVSVEKPQKTSSSIGKPLRSLEEIRDKKKRQRSNSKQQSIKMETELEYLKEDLEKMVKGGWGANNRAKQYIKRGSGVGGGHYGQVETTPPKSTKSHREHLEELRSLIKKGSKQNKNVDKFSQFAEPGQRFNPQVPTTSNNNVKVLNHRNQQPEDVYSPKSHDLPVNSARNKMIHEENEFVLEEDDEGDQVVNLNHFSKPNNPVPSKFNPGANTNTNANTNSNKNINMNPNLKNEKVNKVERMNSESSSQKVANFEMTVKQVRELQDHQHSLAGSGDGSEFLNLDIKKQTVAIKQSSNKPMVKKDHKVIQRASKIKQNLGELADLMSQQELEQLILENNLSQVSENVGDYLTESDFQHMNEEKNFTRSIASNHNERVDLPNTSTKKPTERYDESLNYTESQMSKIKQSFARKDTQKEFEMSSSPQKHSGRLKEQFTLNPNTGSVSNANRFQSIHEPRDEPANEEIEEDIVESYFEESRPKEEKILPLKSKNGDFMKPSKFNNEPPKPQSNNFMNPSRERQEQADEQKSKNYQQLIQNPPKLYEQHKNLDKKSIIKEHSSIKGQSSIRSDEGMEENEPEEDNETVTDKWIRILQLVENNQINEAYEEAFLMDDPIYLIRLLIMTRSPISSLTAENCSKLWTAFLEIYQHNFISIMFVQLFSQAQDLNLIKNSLTIEQMHELLVKLYEVSGTSKGKLSFNAAQLYNKVDQSFRPNQKN